jgi:hypothetical protein
VTETNTAEPLVEAIIEEVRNWMTNLNSVIHPTLEERASYVRCVRA